MKEIKKIQKTYYKISKNYKFGLFFIIGLLVITTFISTINQNQISKQKNTQNPQQQEQIKKENNDKFSTNLDLQKNDNTENIKKNNVDNTETNIDKNSDEYEKLSQNLQDLNQNNESVLGEITDEYNTIKSDQPKVAGASTSNNSPAEQNTAAMLTTIIKGLNDILAGPSSSSTNATIEYQNDNGKIQKYKMPIYSEDNAIDGTFNAIGALYETKPATVNAWKEDIMAKINPVKTIQAQDDTRQSPTYFPGQGYNLLNPIKPLWRSATNMVYIFYILIVIGIAFLIVFRSSIDGQNTVNLFNAIPSLIISLILVYFSYPLSAAFIDLITVGSGVTYGVLIGSQENIKCNNLTIENTPGAYLHCENYKIYPAPSVSDLRQDRGEALDASTDLQINDSPVSIWNAFYTAGINVSTDGADSLLPRDFPGSEVIRKLLSGFFDDGSPAAFLLGLIFTFAAFSASVRLFLALLKEYVILMVAPIGAPFIFLFSAIPGQTTNLISSYFKRLLVASVTFIAVYAILLIVIIISRQPNQIADVVWNPPMLGYAPDTFNSNEPFLNQQLIKSLLGFGLFISAPLIPDMIKQYLIESGQNVIGENFAQASKGGARTLLGIGSGINSAIKGGLGIEPKGR